VKIIFLFICMGKYSIVLNGLCWGGSSKPCDLIVVQRFFYTYVMDMFWIILVGGYSICVGSYITNGTTRR